MKHLDQLSKMIGLEVEGTDIRHISKNGISVHEQFHKLAISYTNSLSEMTKTVFVVPDKFVLEMLTKSFKEAQEQADREMEIERQAHLKAVFEMAAEATKQ
ncbi:hypothetical protein [Aeromonas dhakensis]|uniref:hypothetical protein n=1 Tax=Aeromonas dhakensis TaxID=196024 RepID=UPI0038D01C0B